MSIRTTLVLPRRSCLVGPEDRAVEPAPLAPIIGGWISDRKKPDAWLRRAGPLLGAKRRLAALTLVITLDAKSEGEGMG